MTDISQDLLPEQRARIKIDEQLAEAGWHLCDRNHFTGEHNAVALTKGLLQGCKEVDYLLFLDGRIVGVLEAKRTGIDLEKAASEQAENYTHETKLLIGQKRINHFKK